MFIFLLFFSIFSFSQTLESLKLKVKKAKTAEEKVESILNIVTYFSRRNIDSCLFYSEKAIQLAKKNNKDTLLTKALAHKGIYLAFKRRFKESEYLLKGNFERPIDSITLALNYSYYGNLYQLQKKNDIAIANFLKAIDIYSILNDRIRLGTTYSNIGSLYAQMKKYNKAITYFEKALKYSDGNKPLTMHLKTNLTSLNVDLKNYAKAIQYANESEILGKKLKSIRNLSAIYTNLCMIYTDSKELKDINKAITYGKLALKMKKEIGNTSMLAVTYNNLGRAYSETNNYSNAIFYLKKGLNKAKGNTKNAILNNLKTAYQKNGNTIKALQYANLQIAYKDSINNTKQEEKFIEITQKYEADKKQQQIELQKSKLENQRNLLIGTGLTLLFLSLLGYLWYKNQKTKQELQQASLKHKLLQTQLNPHFLFHSLNSIQSYIYQNKKEKSIEYLSSYSKLMRSIFESTSEDFISIQQDSQTIKEYLTLQELNFDKPVDFSVQVDSKILNFQIPPMLVQPYVENAIQHGIKNTENGKIIVKYADNGTQILVSISDNGTEYHNNTSNNKLHRISSSEVIQQRIQNIEKTYQFNIKKVITPNKNGTQITLIFPKKTYSL